MTTRVIEEFHPGFILAETLVLGVLGFTSCENVMHELCCKAETPSNVHASRLDAGVPRLLGPLRVNKPMPPLVHPRKQVVAQLAFVRHLGAPHNTSMWCV